MATSFHSATPSLGEHTASMSPLYQRREAPETVHGIELLPNPDFVFPARSSAEASPTFDNWNALNRRPPSSQQNDMLPPVVPSVGARGHRSRASRASVALPEFTFNPSASAEPSTTRSLVTPPHSPTLPSPTTPSRAMGHRRGGSEFIGGDGKGGAGLMSTSPMKGDATVPVLNAPGRLGPPASARGHRHRRSGAISCHDLQQIMQPKDSSNGNRGGSAPATPLDNEPKPFFGQHQSRRAASQADFRSTPERANTAPTESPPRVVPRVRVGFSDRVEYIRPLSTISSETESSLSTVRGGHSVSGSLSSVISMGTSSPPSSRMARLPLQTTFEKNNQNPRPQSSGNILDSMTKNMESLRAEDEENERPKSAVSTPGSEHPSSSTASEPKSPKRRSFGWWENKKPTHVLRSSISEPSLLPSPPTSPDSLDDGFAILDEELADAENEKLSKGKKRSWPRSLISRKSKSHGNLKRPVIERSPTPPPPLPTRLLLEEEELVLSHEPPTEEPESFEVNFDIDETVTIVSEEPRSSLNVQPWKNRLHADSDPMSPVIDLDAALGPFRTPQFGANARETKVQPRTRRSMHSLNYQSLNHRRTESAPELVPFDLRNAKVSPATTMPDVFEEEDEEAAAEEADTASQPSSGKPTPMIGEDECEVGLGVQSVGHDEATPRRRPAHLRPSSARTSSGGTLSSSNTPNRLLEVEVVEDFEEPRASSLGRDSDSTITPPLTADDAKAPPPLMNMSLPLPQHPLMTPDTLTSSSISSRQYSNSQVSLNSPRLGTATSSIAEARSSAFSEPGPAVRMSVDDVPSLSSSRSTMTNPPQYPWMASRASGPSSEGRRSSVRSITSMDETLRRRKRASVASLSRLVGVKSKLSIETRPQSQHIMSTSVSMSPNKKKKQNRLSKLMQFWKKQSSTERTDSVA